MRGTRGRKEGVHVCNAEVHGQHPELESGKKKSHPKDQIEEEEAVLDAG